jgi:pSer/pThr/pTyr-binding forkhead associated (FHA) protein
MSGPIVFAMRLILTACLYAFLGWAFLTLWRDIKQQGILLASRKVPPIRLTIARKDTAQQVRHYVQSEITIGRDPTCECPVDDESISARHARLSFHQNQWWLEDLQSTNGTFLNQDKLVMSTVVTSDDSFKCGDTLFIVSLEGDFLMPPTKRI